MNNELISLLETSPSLATMIFVFLLTQIIKDAIGEKFNKMIPLIAIMLGAVIYVPVILAEGTEINITLTIIQGLFIGMATTGAYKGYSSIPKNK